MLVFRYCIETIQRLEWDGNQKYGSNDVPESSNFHKQEITLKRSIKYFLVLVYSSLILCTFVNKQTGAIILSDHSPRKVASDKW